MLSNLTVDYETKPNSAQRKEEGSAIAQLEKETLENLSRKFLKKIAKELQKFYSLNQSQSESTAKQMEERISNALKADARLSAELSFFKVTYAAKIYELIKRIKDKDVKLDTFVSKESSDLQSKVKVKVDE